MAVLTVFTSMVNYIALALAVWLAWYILTRSIRQPISWLASLTLWSICGIFINTLLALNPPPIPENIPRWVAFLFPFWNEDVLANHANDWISGWLVIPAVGFWHHVTMIIRTEDWKNWQIFQVILVYLTNIAAIAALSRTSYMYSEISGDPLLLDTLKPGILYSAFLLILAIIILMSILNLNQGLALAKTALAKRQLRVLIWATLTAGLTAPISYIAVNVDFPMPRVTISLLLASSVVLIGVSVGKYSALIEGRILRRDFIYSATAMGIVALLYSLVIWVSVLIFNVPPAAYIFILIFAFATHSIVDVARFYLDKLFYRKEDRILRKNIREISASVGDQGLQETLEIQLDLACTSVRATFGFIVLFEGDVNKISGRYKFNQTVAQIPREIFIANDFQQLTIGSLHPLLLNVVLLLPIYLSDKQIGAVLFGPPVNSLHYLEDEVDRLLDVSEQITTTIEQHHLGKQLLAQAASTIKATQVPVDGQNSAFTSKNIETALRNLHDYAYLGDCELAKTNLVQSQLCENQKTHIDRGKIVHNMLEEAVHKLRPDKAYSDSIPPREWYPYLILHQAYFEDKLNRDIMSYLYISEGTFNRTRRSAIRAVTRTLEELEANLS